MARLTEPKLPLTGENCPCTVFINNQPQRQSATIKTFSINQEATVHEDNYGGATETRYDKQVNGWTASLEMDKTDNVLFDALAAVDAARQANQPIPNISIKFDYQNRDGTVQAYMLTRLVVTPSKNMGGRTTRVSERLEVKASRYKKVL